MTTGAPSKRLRSCAPHAFVLVCGPAPDRSLDAARGYVAEAVAALAEHAASHGVGLAVEPLHPNVLRGPLGDRDA
jgi:sugar phosphate isomerase/epimerase